MIEGVSPIVSTDTNLLKSGLQKEQQNQAAEPEFEKSYKKPVKNYTDPLMQWPVRGLAFTNDIGAAIMDIAPAAGQALWVPALMYFGADIYDKYRNDKAEYDPSAKRGFKQAIFQALASVVFPVAVVHSGQKTASILNQFTKEGVSLQAKEEIIRYHLNHMSQLKLRDYAENVDEYKKKYNRSLDNMIEETMRKQKCKNPAKILFQFIFGHRHPEAMGKETRENIHLLVNKRIDNIFALRKELIEKNSKPEGISNKMYKRFNTLKETFKNDSKYSDDYINHAAKDVLKKMEENKIFKTKLLKTLGGFAALGLLIKPMDSFVENVIMQKYVEPGLEKFGREEFLKAKKKFLS